MKKGFTLIEMIAVVGILAFMSLIILPKLLDQFNNKREELSNTAKTIIYSAAELYLNDNIEIYPKTVGTPYCVKLQELVDLNYLKAPLTDIETGNDINLEQKVKTIVNKYGQYDNFSIGNCE